MKITVQNLWEFHCIECGVGHVELGRLAADHEIFCIVCEHDYGRLVKLHRWLTEADSECESAAHVSQTERPDS